MTSPGTVYWNFRSPYSWLALERLNDLGLRERLTFVPVWDPGPALRRELEARGRRVLYEPMSRAKHLYILQDVKRQAQRAGRTFVWPVDHDPAWDGPHLAFLAAQAQGRAWDLYDHLIALRWGRGQDICARRVVADALSACGIPASSDLSLLASEPVMAAGLGALGSAYEDDVFGMPYFKVGFERFWGLDRLEAFVHALQSSTGLDPLSVIPRGAQRRVGAYDRDAPGGCG